ncbi:MAG: beta-galactosidase [Rheinheimera sp.]|nr:beta-galactosidase [Rheinheimera sp.]
MDALNSAWGNVFWSMEYRHFGEIELPILAVTETNPAHQLAYRRFSSDQVVHFHDEMVRIIRAHAPGRFVTHNFIPMVDTQTDNYALAKPLDFASFDNYPLGRSDLFFAKRGAAMFKPYMRTGHPDFSSYYFDQTRGLTGKHFWIMEQQPGPVNWAKH